MPGLIVIGYDGSGDAAAAVAVAARTLDADAALVANVWLPGLAGGERVLPIGAAAPPVPDADEQLEAVARDTAREGAELARQAGLDAEPVVLHATSKGEIGERLATLADERGAAAIVVGRHAVSRLESVIRGSVADAIVRHARCPVLVVPAPEEG
jgi:nucleotide-binding universal stress UspA family protein